MEYLQLEFDFPPSVNHYYRRVGRRTLISKTGRAFRESVCSAFSLRYNTDMITAKIAVGVELFPPDNGASRRDTDNYLKSLFDAMQHAGVYKDDSQIKLFYAHMNPVDKSMPDGMVAVEVRAYDPTLSHFKF